MPPGEHPSESRRDVCINLSGQQGTTPLHPTGRRAGRYDDVLVGIVGDQLRHGLRCNAVQVSHGPRLNASPAHARRPRVAHVQLRKRLLYDKSEAIIDHTIRDGTDPATQLLDVRGFTVRDDAPPPQVVADIGRRGEETHGRVAPPTPAIAADPANAAGLSSRSMARSRFHFAVLSERVVEPTLIWPAPHPTARSASQLSSVSPERAETTVAYPARRASSITRLAPETVPF